MGSDRTAGYEMLSAVLTMFGAFALLAVSAMDHSMRCEIDIRNRPERDVRP